MNGPTGNDGSISGGGGSWRAATLPGQTRASMGTDASCNGPPRRHLPRPAAAGDNDTANRNHRRRRFLPSSRAFCEKSVLPTPCDRAAVNHRVTGPNRAPPAALVYRRALRHTGQNGSPVMGRRMMRPAHFSRPAHYVRHRRCTDKMDQIRTPTGRRSADNETHSDHDGWRRPLASNLSRRWPLIFQSIAQTKE